MSATLGRSTSTVIRCWGIDRQQQPHRPRCLEHYPGLEFPVHSLGAGAVSTAFTFIEQVYAAQVRGCGAYGLLDDTFYCEFGGYRPLSNNTQLALGVDTAGESPITGSRLLAGRGQKNIGDHSWEIGTFGLASRVFPMGLSQSGTNSFTDIGVDTQYQYLGDPHMVTFRGAWIHENHNTSASQTLGLANNSNDRLRSLNASASYIYDQTWSLSAGRLPVGGTPDAAFYGTATGSPNSAGWIFELAYLPFSHGGPSFWPWLNFRIGLQYTQWSKFDGATTNIDGMGRNASDNNTFFVYVWTMF